MEMGTEWFDAAECAVIGEGPVSQKFGHLHGRYVLRVGDHDAGQVAVEGTAKELHAFSARVADEVSALVGPPADGPLLRVLRNLERVRDAAEGDNDTMREAFDEAIDYVSDELDDSQRCARCRRGITDPERCDDDETPEG